MNQSDIKPLPPEEFTPEQLEMVAQWRERVTTNPFPGDLSFFRFLDRSSDGRLGGDKLAATLDMIPSFFYDGQWHPLAYDVEV